MQQMKIPTDPEEFSTFVHDLTKSHELKQQDIVAKLGERDREYEELKEKYELLRRAFFGRKSEKLTDEDVRQAQLFNEAEIAADESEGPAEQSLSSEPTQDTQDSAPRQRRGRRAKLPDSLPRKEFYHDLPEDQKQCGCGQEMVKIGEEISEQVHIKPAEIIVHRHIRPKYACRACEGSADEDRQAVVCAPAVEQLIPKSIASPSLLAHIIIGKYCDALPLYRQQRQFSRLGIELSRASMARWIITLGSQISPLLEEMDRSIRSGPLIGMDETRIQVHREQDKQNTSTSFMWVARGGNPESPVIRYTYHSGRSGTIPKTYLEGYEGALQTDGYSGYTLAVKTYGLTHIGCMAHLRRKFYEITKLSAKSPAAMSIVNKIGRIYVEEQHLRQRDLTDAELVAQRIERVIPLITGLQREMEKKSLHVTPSSALGKAIGYALGQLPKIKLYAAIPSATLA